MVVCASLPLARISAKDPFFGGAARAAAGAGDEGLLMGLLLALELLIFRAVPLWLGRWAWAGEGRTGGFATVAGLEEGCCAKRGVLGGPSDRRSSLAFRLIWVSGRGLAGGASPLPPLIWARRSPI